MIRVAIIVLSFSRGINELRVAQKLRNLLSLSANRLRTQKVVTEAKAETGGLRCRMATHVSILPEKFEHSDFLALQLRILCRPK